MPRNKWNSQKISLRLRAFTRVNSKPNHKINVAVSKTVGKGLLGTLAKSTICLSEYKAVSKFSTEAGGNLGNGYLSYESPLSCLFSELIRRIHPKMRNHDWVGVHLNLVKTTTRPGKIQNALLWKGWTPILLWWPPYLENHRKSC